MSSTYTTNEERFKPRQKANSLLLTKKKIHLDFCSVAIIALEMWKVEGLEVMASEGTSLTSNNRRRCCGQTLGRLRFKLTSFKPWQTYTAWTLQAINSLQCVYLSLCQFNFTWISFIPLPTCTVHCKILFSDWRLASHSTRDQFANYALAGRHSTGEIQP